MVLTFILTIMLTLLVVNGGRINLGEDPLAAWRPISTIVGKIFAGLGDGAQAIIIEIAYWILHLGVVLLFLTELPEGKHFHIVTSLPAVLLRNLDPRGQLPASPESVDKSASARWNNSAGGRCLTSTPVPSAGAVRMYAQPTIADYPCRRKCMMQSNLA